MSQISRRRFLRQSAEAAVAVGVLGYAGTRRRQPAEPVRWSPHAFAPVKHASVAVVKASSYDIDLESIVFDGLRTVGADLRGKRVLLKPNLVEYDPTTAINTDPRLVAATVVAARRLGAASVVVGEGPGHRRDTEYVVDQSGLLDALRSVEATFVDLNAAPVVARRLRTRYTKLGTLWLPEPVVNADVVVSMPKMKTHHWGGVTLSLKNCFGCVPGRVYGWPKNVLHWAGLEGSIVDVAAAVRPTLAIVDGIVGMEGNGPISGTPVHAGVLVFGRDPVAVDATAAELMRVNPERIEYLHEAGRFLGQSHLDRIEQRGDDVTRNSTPFALLPQFASLRS